MNGQMQIYSILDGIKQELDECPMQSRKGVDWYQLDVAKINDLMQDLNATIPQDIRKATEIIHYEQDRKTAADEDARDIVAQAQQDADELIAKAQAEAEAILAQARQDAADIHMQAEQTFEERVAESAVYQEACLRARSISDETEANAGMIFDGARRYADDVMADLQNYLSDYLRIVADNRAELGVQAESRVQPAEPAYREPAPRQIAYEAPAYAEEPAQSQYAEAEEEPAVKARDEEEEEPVRKAPARRRPVEPDYDEDDEEEAPKKEKKKGFFSKLFEIEEDDEDDEDDWDEEPAPKASKRKARRDEDDEEEAPKKKKKKGLFSFDEDDEDDDEFDL